MGNLRSVQNALDHLGASHRTLHNLDGVEKLIIPGVGAFGAAMERLAPLAADIRAMADSGVPILGICLGQQLLFETSEELGEHTGLAILAGRVRMLPTNLGVKVPHVGWAEINPTKSHPVLADWRPGDPAYFVHSHYTDCEDPGDVLATARHGIEFPAAVARGSVVGVQYHPEKSGPVGLAMLRRFAEC